MTENGPRQSTMNVRYLVCTEGVKCWALGIASALAFMLFGSIFAATMLLRPPRSGDSV